jgi:hypothetical protein
MKAPDIIYTDGRNTCASTPIFSNIDGNVKYIRTDLAKQPEADLLEEAYMRGFIQGAKEERKDLAPLINRLCEAILFEWKDAADLARKTLTQIKAQEE